MMRTVVLISVGAIVAVLVVLGCPKQQPPAPSQNPAKQAAPLTGLPIKMTVKQRTTTAAPGSNDALSLTIDDVTRGQVMASLADKQGKVVLASASLTAGKSAPFELGGVSYVLTLEELDNELVGEDSATFIISQPNLTVAENTSAPVSGQGLQTGVKSDELDQEAERTRIKCLIKHIGNLEGAVFIRNGQEHSPAEAADHLRRKWTAAGDQIATADEFIDKIARKSATSGEPYRIRLKDGKEVDAGDYLREQLKKADEQP
jgi:hypothetical protein